MKKAKGKNAVVTVGKGRGFVVEVQHPTLQLDIRYVITAAHCLPWFPPCASFSGLEKRTYQKLLGPIGSKQTVWAECAFVDPVADIAVLCSPDEQERPQEAERYDALVEKAAALAISDVPARAPVPAWLLSLRGRWFRCVAQHFGGAFWISEATQAIKGGMSGSPILAADGLAIGVLTCSSGSGSPTTHTEGGPNPRLAANLPRWLRLAKMPTSEMRRVRAKMKVHIPPLG